MPDRAVIETAYPSLREAAEHYGVSANKLRELVARFEFVVKEGASSKARLAANPQLAGDLTSARVRRKKRIRLQVAAKRPGTKSKK